MSLATTVQSFLDYHQLSAETLIVAVSGGADSLALLHALAQAHPKSQLIAAHLNHKLRGAESERDQAQVESICTAWGINRQIGQKHVKELHYQWRESIETTARRARYQFLATVALKSNTRFVLTAHHADDQVETILANLMRGAGLRGLRGMLPVAPLPYRNGHDARLSRQMLSKVLQREDMIEPLLLLRPLLSIERVEIKAYCAEHAISFIHDSSNDDTSHTRNRIRHQLVPLIKQLSPAATQRISSMAEIVAEEDQLLNSLLAAQWDALVLDAGDGWVKLDLAGWQSRSVGVQRRMVRRGFEQVDAAMGDLSFGSVENAREILLRGEVGSQAQLSADCSIEIGYTEFTITSANANLTLTAPVAPSGQPIALAAGQSVQLGNLWELGVNEAQVASLAELKAQADDRNVFVTAGEPLFLRCRIEGERFRPIHLNGSKKLKDIMINRKIPAALRPTWPVVATNTHPVWLVGHLLDDRAKVQTVAKTILHLSLTKKS